MDTRVIICFNSFSSVFRNVKKIYTISVSHENIIDVTGKVFD